jgi:hypothetical protein
MKKFLPINSANSTSVALNIKAVTDAMWDAACKALDDSTHEIFLISTETYCPVDKGDLKASAKDELIVDTSTEHTREISYDTDYAKIVHEVPYNHYNPPMAQWKYLEVALRLQEKKTVDNISSAARDSVDS